MIIVRPLYDPPTPPKPTRVSIELPFDQAQALQYLLCRNVGIPDAIALPGSGLDRKRIRVLMDEIAEQMRDVGIIASSRLFEGPNA